MAKSRYIIRQINLINLALAGALAFFVYMLFSLVNAAFEFSPPPAKSTDAAIAEEVVKAAESPAPSTYDYTTITEQNLFHPDRKMVASTTENAPLVRPDFVLYGTMITDDANIAFLSDLKEPRTTPGRGGRQWALNMGDKLNGYTLSEIYTNSVVMVNGDDRIELTVIDPAKAKVRNEGITAGRKTEEVSSKEAEGNNIRSRSKRAIPRRNTQKP
ncbi:MAG: hypothetical protein HZC48_00385 [Nitrospirae bacterium]|nr:hypothetical protein [Nitrospirota bacterium]